MTEHALLDDNGDGSARRRNGFRDARVKSAANGKSIDGIRAHQVFLFPANRRNNFPGSRARRDELERKLSALRLKKTEIKEE